MPAEDHVTSVIATFSGYSVILVGIGVWAYKREKALKAAHQDEMTAHYLGGRSFGPIMTAATVFASLFNGFSIIGAPSESFYRGFFSLTWIVSVVGIISGYFATGLRLRRASEVRNHQSSVDFITDRFQSQYCRASIMLLQVVPTGIFLAGQIVAIKLAFNPVFGLEPDNQWPSIIIVGVILLFEWAGGLNSVAMTDTIQGFVIFVSYLCVPIAIYMNYGGYEDIDLSTFPRPDFFQTPSKFDQWQFWQFTIINIAFFGLPPLIQRTYAARDIGSLKLAYGVLVCGVWMAIMVGIFVGIMAVKVFGPGFYPPSPFNSMMENLMDLGGFPKVTAVVVVTAFLAAVMSTIDSLIIAASQLAMNEMVMPWVRNNERLSSDRSVTWFGRACSFVITAASLAFGLHWEGTTFSIIELQLSMTLQTVPAWFIGLYSKHEFHPWPIATGAWVGGLWVVLFYEYYMRDNPDRLPINNGVSGLGINLAIVLIGESTRVLLYPNKTGDRALEPEESSNTNTNSLTTDPTTDGSESDEGKKEPRLLFPNRPSWDVPSLAHFGDKPMSWRVLKKYMSGTHEVATNPYWVTFMLISMSLATPLVPQKEPPILEDGTFAYEPTRVFGIPWFAWKSILFSVIPSFFLLIEIVRMPTKFGPEKEDWEIFDDVPQPSFAEKERLIGGDNSIKFNAQSTKEIDDSSGDSRNGADGKSLPMEQAIENKAD
ncbi:unnamed protein product [Cylindrotheca closterium]|uniref:Sodium/solute symporter n=1 Tax=Cylindrotheca closterium TaxID=2856 RepID=A0AAD2FSE7_9STRA|nr:unnamed protein product [Cylindrotheca closterium]